jgi:hypothetical protein
MMTIGQAFAGKSGREGGVMRSYEEDNNGRIVRIVINPHGEWIDRLPTTDQVRGSITEEVVITMPQGVYRVGKTKSQAALMIECEDPKTGEWRIVWSVAMGKDIGKRMLNVIALAGAH